MRNFLKMSKSIKYGNRLLILLIFIFGINVVQAQVTTLQNWTNVYEGISTSAQTPTFNISAGSGTSRLLVVAVASTLRTNGTNTVALSYGGRSLTFAQGDLTVSSRQHTAIYYLDEANIDAASGTTLSVRVQTNNNIVETKVWAAVFDYVDQASPITNSRNLNNNTAVTTFNFGTNLTINSGDQAIMIANSCRLGNTTARTFDTYTNFDLIDEIIANYNTSGTSSDIGNRIGIFNFSTVPTTNTSSNGAIVLSGSSFPSMTGVSINGCTTPIVNAGADLPPICQGGTSAALGGSISGSATGGTWSSSVSGGTFTPSATSLNATWAPPASFSGTATLTLTSTGGSCGAATASKTLIVNPSPNSVTASATENSICSGNSTSLLTTFSYAPSSASNSVSLTTSIPDNDQTTGATSQITLPNTCASANEVSAVTLNISHTWVADLDIYLVSPNGTEIPLCLDKGGDTDNIVATFQTGGIGLPTGNTLISTPANGPYAPETAFSTFSGPAAGIWTLRVFDDASQDTGALNSWSITVNSATCGAMTYSWSPTTGLSSSTVENPTASPNVTTNYTVTVTPPNGCSATSSPITITVTSPPSAGTLSGTQAICSNGTTTFGSTVSGGAWTSGNTAVATINSATGVVTPVAVGTATMTYTVTGTGGCANATATRTVTVTAAPTAGTLSGTQTVCSNGTTTFASTVSGGAWTSGNTAVATINSASGVVTPVAAGTATMTYTVTGTGGCANATATRTVTVTAAPSAGTLSGTQSVCSNGTTTFASTVSGGAWTSGNTAVATINSASGVVTPVAAGTATMTYTVTGTGGCANATATRTVTVTAAPTAGTLSGTQTICSNGTTTFGSTVSGGAWTSGNTAVATINSASGVVTPVAAGTATMTYTVTGTGGCANATATRTVTVTAAPSAGTLSGTQSVCSNGTTTFASTVSGGAWTSGNTAVATINSASGVVTPVAAGTATMTYTVTGTGGCANATATRTVTVTAAPTAGTLSGTQTICSNGTTTFGSTVSGGAWTSGNTAVATINSATGVVTPVAAGTATMTYTVTGTGGCANATATRTVTVTAAPTAGTLSGTQTICSNGTTTFGSSVSGGAWTSGNTAVATINSATGVVTPVAAGTATMTYTVTGTGGCANATATRTVTVTAAPSAGTLSGTQTICSNGTTTFGSSVSGGAWTSGNTAVATINSASGVVTPVTAGTATMTYTVTGTGGCANATATRTVTVSPFSVGGSVSGTATICSGATSGLLTLSGHTGNVIRWESAVSPFTTWTPIANTATTYTSDALTQETKFRAVVQNGACAEAYSSAATLSFASTTWNGTSWVGGEPTANKALIISANYTSPGANYNLQGCSLTVQNNAVVTVVPQDSVILSGALTVTTGSTMTFEAQAHLIQSGTTNLNSGTVIVKANSSPIKRLDYTLWSAPVAGQQMQAFSPLTLANRFYNYDSNTNFYTVVTSPSTTSFETAKGVLIRVANTHSASQPQSWTGTFTGVPNSGTYTIPLANFGPGKRFTLVGNPYPSPMDPEAFITNPNNAAAITGTLYLWRKTNGSNKPSYCTFNLGGFITNGEERANEVANLPHQVIQTGQGFFVEGTGAGSGNVVFDNTMRVDDHTNSFLRTANTAHSANTVERNRIWLNVTNAAGAFSQAMIGYVTNATNGFDMNYDGKYINDGEIALASVLDAEPYAIQCKALPFSTSDVIPMQFTATTAGTYSIAVDRVDGLFASGQAVYLRDTVTGTVHNLSDGAYSFATESGTFNARFEVVFQASTLGVTDPVLTENQVVIYKTPSNEISINTGNFVMDHVMIYDLAGRLLFQQKDINNSQALIKVGFATEVLLVKIKTQDGKSVTKKVLFPRTTLRKDLKISTIQVAEDE